MNISDPDTDTTDVSASDEIDENCLGDYVKEFTPIVISDENKKNIQEQFFDIDFSDVKEEQKEMSKEDIIAAAEAAAFQEDNNK